MTTVTAPPWSSSTGSSGRHASESMVAFTGMRKPAKDTKIVALQPV